jgi:choline transport protein
MEVKAAQTHVDSELNFNTESGLDTGTVGKGATSEDARDMLRMGKTQETKRNFRSVTILGFCMVLLSTWEAILATSVFALSNGGTAGLIWGYLIVMVGFGFVVASLAEMASM